MIDKERIVKASKESLLSLIEEIPYLGKPLVIYYKTYSEKEEGISEG